MAGNMIAYFICVGVATIGGLVLGGACAQSVAPAAAGAGGQAQLQVLNAHSEWLAAELPAQAFPTMSGCAPAS
jgi:hypothetical protein